MDEKHEIIAQLHALINEQLFNNDKWICNKEQCEAITQMLSDLRLQELVPGESDTTRNTALGSEFQLHLLMVFFGLWEPSEMPTVLKGYGLISGAQEDILLEQIFSFDEIGASDNVERLLRPVVQKAFHKHFNPSQLLN
jgi:hypothetical protein